MLFCDRPTASAILRNLERKAWISRERDAANRKYRLVRLAEAGAAKLVELRTQSPFENDAFDPLGCFDAPEVAQLEHLLAKLHEHLKTIPSSEERKR
jgi:DNA-binding MarR family transcriptional regulator